MLKKKSKKEIIELGVLEGEDSAHLSWKSRSKALSWDFMYYMPILLRDTLRELARDPEGCPGWLDAEFDGDTEAACAEWKRRLNGMADKFDYAAKISRTSGFLSPEDQETINNYFSQDCHLVRKTAEDGSTSCTLPPTPDYIKEIWKKENAVAEDMHAKLKEALQELGELWYDLWD